MMHEVVTAADPSAARPPAERRSLLVPQLARWNPAQGPIIELCDVGIAFGPRRLFAGLSLTVDPGRTTVVIGQSGSGKSVLLKLMMGLLAPDEGEVRLFGQNLAELSPVQQLELRKRCAMLFQSYALLDSRTVRDNIAFPLRENTRLPAADIASRVEELLELLELQGSGDRLPAELSGGMRKRVSLARALITQPEVVFFDEPTTGLDPVMIEFVDEMIKRSQERFQITSVIISHDMSSVLHLADRVAMLHEGQIVAQGTPEQLSRIEHPQLQAFLSAGGSGRLGGAATATATASAAPPAVVARPAAPAPTPAAEEPPAISFLQVNKTFGTHQVLRGVDLAIPPHRITIVIGASGSGKSVIIKHIMGLLRADSGQVLVFDRDMTTLPESELPTIQGRIGFLFQGAALFDSLTIEENVAFPLRERARRGAARLTAAELREKTQAMLEQVRIPAIAARYPGEVSAGERKRAGLARALITQPELLIYDEPTTGQDPIMIRGVDEMIRQTWERHRITSIVISHDMQSTFRIGHRIAMLHEGQIRACGTPQELLATEDPVVRRFIFAGGGGT